MSNNKRTVRITPTEHKPNETMAVIERWPARYPIPIENMPPEVQKEIPVGTTGYVVILGYKLKEGRDRSKPYNWKWRFEHMATDDEMQEYIEARQNAAAKPAQFPAMSPQDQARQNSIHRQVALKSAIKHVAAASRHKRAAATTDEVKETAEDFYHWLQTPPDAETASEDSANGHSEEYMEDFHMAAPPVEAQEAQPQESNGTGGKDSAAQPDAEQGPKLI